MSDGNAARIALLSGKHQWGESGLRSELHVGAVFDKLIDNRDLTFRKRPHQGGLSAHGFLRIGFGAPRQQCTDCLEITPAGGRHERRFARHDRHVGISPGG